MAPKLPIKSIGQEARLGVRMSAHVMWTAGHGATSISSTLGISLRSAQRWVADFVSRSGAAPAPEARRGPKTGTVSPLKPKDEAKIIRLITDKTPEQMRFDFALWTCEAVRDLIGRVCGVSLCARSVRRLLAKRGFTLQRPQKRALERDEAAVRAWLQEEYPRIKRAAKREKALIYWCDESCVKASCARPRGYAPKGKSPVAAMTANQGCKVNVISAVSNTGKARFMLSETGVNTERFKTFMARLAKDSGRKVYLVADNLRVHHAKALRPWLEKNKRKIRLFFLPSYSPDLNPDEYLNQDIKQAVNKRAGARTPAGIANVVASHLRKRARQPRIVKNFFKHPSISYAA